VSKPAGTVIASPEPADLEGEGLGNAEDGAALARLAGRL